MSDKELYQQKMQARLDEWRARGDKPKARAFGAPAEPQLKNNTKTKNLGRKV